MRNESVITLQRTLLHVSDAGQVRSQSPHDSLRDFLRQAVSSLTLLCCVHKAKVLHIAVNIAPSLTSAHGYPTPLITNLQQGFPHAYCIAQLTQQNALKHSAQS